MNVFSGPVLLTGVAGFIGSHTALELLRRGLTVVGVDNFDPFYPRLRKERNLQELTDLAKLAGAEGRLILKELDLTDQPQVKACFAEHRPAGVIHLAAKAGVRPSIEDPAGYMRANVVATSIVLQEAHQAGCARVVAASSSSVYGNSPQVPFSETMDVSAPISPYAASKRACELLAGTHFHLTKQPVAMLRFFTVYGPRQRPDLAISKFIDLVASGKPIPMFGNGETSRDYTFIDDIVAGIIASYERIDSHGFRIWNLGNSQPVTLSEMIATVGRVVGLPAKIEPQPVMAGDVERTFADLTRAKAELDYDPKTTLEQGIAKQWGWRQAQPQ